MKSVIVSSALSSAALFLSLASSAQATQTFFASGASPADIQTTVDAFRAGLGGANNGVGNPTSGGRREINWDGVPDSFSSPNNLPGNFFNSNSPRGLTMTTPGTGFRVSADSDNPTATPTLFADLDPVIAGNFSTFSAQRIFTAMGSNITDVFFFVPGTNTPATVLGFGVVFTDVEIAQTSSIQFYDVNDQPVGGVVAPVSGNAGLSFIAMIRDSAEIFRVRITSGQTQINGGDPSLDYVAMDDFIYGEPVAIPAPSALALLALGGAAAIRRRR
ncbi:MAG: PEP-CTERM sorting domain-containing protein [Phycisphaerales bacterium]|nr:PEP-CTERM sorting domain-containing protein [Phycisphaerales bacterium]